MMSVWYALQQSWRQWPANTGREFIASSTTTPSQCVSTCIEKWFIAFLASVCILLACNCALAKCERWIAITLWLSIFVEVLSSKLVLQLLFPIRHYPVIIFYYSLYVNQYSKLSAGNGFLLCDVLTDYICTHREDKGTKWTRYRPPLFLRVKEEELNKNYSTQRACAWYPLHVQCRESWHQYV